jgi:precorrin-6x reductase
MPTVIATHDVKDTAHWLASPKRAEIFTTIGVTNIRTFVNPQNRNSVALIMDVPDMDAMMALLESDEGRAAEEHDGVLAETIEIFIEE